ncbi:site-2 protease family protein [Arthrobacter russicus]|uniref:Zinc metalloprotease n=1 Tax=Arthrobacter russicus TaxID=172040 RepID=A0ABU1J5Y0_9MICC|nr:site-2 protease family protein [Arthrobacter russicus]MDN5669277.1 site-2 protease family protein [Renibacterium salmoninarum]MDR6267830.1 Zn-dependent protease [Arthrobacter russicus]
MSGQEPQAELRVRREGIPLGRIAGVPIILAYSWFLIAAFTVLVFGPQVSELFPSLGIGAYGVALVYALLLLFSVLVHELAHALAARVYHWPTQKIVLNLWGGHTQFENFTATPWRSLVVALSGPLANFVLAGIAYLVLMNVSAPINITARVIILLLNIFVWANFLIGIFNVLPGLPLDGGRLVESIVWRVTGSQEKGTVAAGWAGRVVVVLLLVGVLGVPLLTRQPLNIQTALFSLFIAGFLWVGASQAISGARMRLRLPEISAGKLSGPAIGMSDEVSVSQVLNTVSANPSVSVVLCGRDGRPAYLVDPLVLATVPLTAAASTPATAVSHALPEGGYVPESASGQELVQYLAQLSGSEYAVIDPRGQVTGLLRQRVVVAAITGKSLPDA